MKEKVLNYLYGLEKYGILLGLDNIHILMSLLSNPHKKIKTIHVVGTNGKGSTCAFLSEILISAGYRVGVYTSPHLIRFNERIRINNRQISNRDIERLALEIKEMIDKSAFKDRPYTFFEVTTALAFQYFYEKQVQIAIIEAGLGGRLDATNVLTPELTIITNIGLEHKEFLGDSIEKIAFEKASVIKEKVPAITACDTAEGLKVIKEIAKQKKASLYILGKDFNFSEKGLYDFGYSGIGRNIENLMLKNLVGINQFKNASLALAAAEILMEKGYRISDLALKKGIRNARWEGRFEIIRKEPPFIIDGAHNPHGVTALVENLKRFYPSKRFIFVINVLRDKDMSEMIGLFRDLALKIFVAPNKNERSYSYNELKKRFGKEKNFSVFKNIPLALKSALSSDQPLIFTGSLYGIGEAKEFLKDEI